ncbi:hypothetical protein [Streptomyces enissocaesilis]|uniref:hypothetical protein n=1 Tax=Streptomyces enissocaesilis TaxID=332589 RepID=UPI0031D1E349
MLTERGHREAKKPLEPKGIRVPALREEEYDPDTGELLAGGYGDHAAAVTPTAAEVAREQAAMRLASDDDRGQEPGKHRRGLFRTAADPAVLKRGRSPSGRRESLWGHSASTLKPNFDHKVCLEPLDHHVKYVVVC